jgi:pimeloyl-ACP methyl ester carboxylesterase
MRISVGDVDLWFDVAGSSLVLEHDQFVERPTIIALHGGPGFDHSYLKPEFSEGLADQAQIVFLDQRGQGRSDAGDPSGWRLDQWADDVAVFCRTLGIRKPVLMGHSFGGFVALAAAARHPELASGLIVLASAAYTDRELTIDRFGQLGGPEAATAARDLFNNPDDETIVAAYMQRCLSLYAHDAASLSEKIGRTLARPETQTHFFQPTGEFGHFDYRPALAQSRVPTLVLQGSLDPIIPPATAEATADSFPPGVAQFVLIDGASHDLTGERWPDVRPIVQDFLRRLPQPETEYPA